MKSIKYLAAYLVPAFCFYGLIAGGWASYATVIFSFGLIPFADQFWPQDTSNLSEPERENRLASRIFDWLLYLNLPIIYAAIGLFIYQLNSRGYSSSEMIGQVLSLGIVLGSCGINVGHELGHRQNKMEQGLAKLLLLPSLYQHFFIEHNRGHHKNVATPLDPATARRNEFMYTFWFRSMIGSYRNAWRLEYDRLQRAGKAIISWNNEMIRFTVYTLAYIAIVILLCNSLSSAFFVLIAGLVGILLLESINYIEHYGLERKLLPNGRYERTRPQHSWNANYHLGRIILYELTRHSDHHFIASKKYQVLDHHDEALVLPVGYPASILMAMIPPLWFYVMHRRIAQGTSLAVG